MFFCYCFHHFFCISVMCTLALNYGCFHLRFLLFNLNKSNILDIITLFLLLLSKIHAFCLPNIIITHYFLLQSPSAFQQKYSALLPVLRQFLLLRHLCFSGFVHTAELYEQEYQIFQLIRFETIRH